MSQTNAARQQRAPTIRQSTVRANGIEIAYLEMGEGPLALLLHGFPDTPHGWSDVMPALSDAGYRVVAPFTRGYAPTQMPSTRSTTLEELAADALALIEALGHREAVLIGHDWGAATAYLAAATDPARIVKLIAVGIPHPAAIRPSLALLWAGRHFITLRLPGAVGRAQANHFALIDHLYRRWSPTWRFGPEETAPVKKVFSDRASLDAALGYYRGVRAGHIEPPLRRPISVPTLAVAGLDDPGLEVEVYERARARFSGEYRVASMPGGHFVHRESPAEFRAAVLEFLSS